MPKTVTEEDLIASYKADLVGEAELARDDLAEIEDHLRTLADELREGGMPRLEAVREACIRLGEPRAVAREHARVRSPFGARLSRMRAWSAAALLVPALVQGARVILPTHTMSFFTIELALGTVLLFALVARLSWARPVLLGGLGFFTIQVVMSQFNAPPHPWWIVPYAGALAFLAPWRKHELTGAGLALACQTWAFGAAGFALEFQISTPTGYHYVSAGGQLGFVAIVLATAGTILRARWSALLTAFSAFSLAVAWFEMSPMKFDFGFPTLMYATILALLLSGVVAALLGTFLSWRTARSTLGTLQHVLH